MVRRLGVLALGVLAAAVAAGPAAADTPWSAKCSGQGPERRCTVTATRDFMNNRGGRNQVTITIVRDDGCATLHVGFDVPIAVDRTVRITLDGEAPAYDIPVDDMIVHVPAWKETRRIGVACAPTPRLLPQLTSARILRLDFSTEPRNRTRVYHWVGLTDRSVKVDLEGLAAALDRISAER